MQLRKIFPFIFSILVGCSHKPELTPPAPAEVNYKESQPEPEPSPEALSSPITPAVVLKFPHLRHHIGHWLLGNQHRQYIFHGIPTLPFTQPELPWLIGGFEKKDSQQWQPQTELPVIALMFPPRTRSPIQPHKIYASGDPEVSSLAFYYGENPTRKVLVHLSAIQSHLLIDVDPASRPAPRLVSPLHSRGDGSAGIATSPSYRIFSVPSTDTPQHNRSRKLWHFDLEFQEALQAEKRLLYCQSKNTPKEWFQCWDLPTEPADSKIELIGSIDRKLLVEVYNPSNQKTLSFPIQKNTLNYHSAHLNGHQLTIKHELLEQALFQTTVTSPMTAKINLGDHLYPFEPTKDSHPLALWKTPQGTISLQQGDLVPKAFDAAALTSTAPPNNPKVTDISTEKFTFSFLDQDHGVTYRLESSTPLHHVQSKWDEFARKHRGALVYLFPRFARYHFPKASLTLTCPDMGVSHHEIHQLIHVVKPEAVEFLGCGSPQRENLLFASIRDLQAHLNHPLRFQVNQADATRFPYSRSILKLQSSGFTTEQEVSSIGVGLQITIEFDRKRAIAAQIATVENLDLFDQVTMRVIDKDNRTVSSSELQLSAEPMTINWQPRKLTRWFRLEFLAKIDGQPHRLLSTNYIENYSQ